MNNTTMEKGEKSSRNKKYSFNHLDPYKLLFLLSAVMIVITSVSIAVMSIKNSSIDDLLLLSSSVLIIYFLAVMVFSRFRIERKREERIEKYLNEFKSQVMSQLKGKNIDDLNNKTFEEVVRDQEQHAFKQYLSELSGDSQLYYYLAHVQHDLASTLTEQKKYNEALLAEELANELFRTAYSLEKAQSKEGTKKRKPVFISDNAEDLEKFSSKLGYGPGAFIHHEPVGDVM